MPPRVSIGLPVYNGEKFIRESIDSLLIQTFKDFEIIISDNASTDSTEQICREYLLVDKRVKYFRQAENKGALANFLTALEKSSGYYFMWASSDDKFANTHLENLVQALDLNQGDAVSMSNAKIMDESGSILSQTNIPDVQNSKSKKTLSYTIALGSKHHYFIYGLWIRTVLNDLLPIPNCRFGDRVFILFASTRISFRVVEEATYYRRKHSQTSGERYKKADSALSKLYSSNFASFKSVYYLKDKLTNNLNKKENTLIRYKIIMAYAFWVLFGTLNTMNITKPFRVILKSLGLRPKNFGMK